MVDGGDCWLGCTTSGRCSCAAACSNFRQCLCNARCCNTTSRANTYTHQLTETWDCQLFVPQLTQLTLGANGCMWDGLHDQCTIPGSCVVFLWAKGWPRRPYPTNGVYGSWDQNFISFLTACWCFQFWDVAINMVRLWLRLDHIVLDGAPRISPLWVSCYQDEDMAAWWHLGHFAWPNLKFPVCYDTIFLNQLRWEKSRSSQWWLIQISLVAKYFNVMLRS